MTLLAIIRYHDSTDNVVSFNDNTSDAGILDYIKATFGPIYKIKLIQICPVRTEYSNVAPIETWLKTNARLQS